MIDNRTVFVEEYQQNIPLFLIKNRTGRVHSVFENGINIRMGERLFFIGTLKNGRLPFGIHLQNKALKELITSIYTTSAVYWDNETQRLLFENGHLAVSMKNGVPFRNIIQPPSTLRTPVKYIANFYQVLLMNGEMTGLDLDIGQFVIDYLEKQQPENNMAQQVCHLMAALNSEVPDEMEKVVRYFLGRGKGLTPSGDDHLVGLLAIHRITHAFSPLFLQTLQDILERESITTDIGKEYLLHALNGEFSSSIVHILNALSADQTQVLEKHLLHLLTMGHSSGVDTAFGMLIGLLSMKNRGK